MFRHIIGYESLIARLCAYKEKQEWPKSMVLAGAGLTGRMSLALESARVLLCEQDGVSDCTCQCCRRHSLLETNELMVMGPRTSVGDIHYFLHMLESSQRRETQGSPSQKTDEPDQTGNHQELIAKKMFLRRLAIFLKRFDEVLLSDKKRKQVAPLYGPLFECLHTDLSSPFSISYKKITELIEQLTSYHLPDIDSMRNIQEYCQFGNERGMKVLILENIHQYSLTVMHSLLKFLEEPPASLTIIATSTTKPQHAKNFASRFQWFYLPVRSSEEQAAVCERYFGKKATSLDILLQRADETSMAERLCVEFLNSLQANASDNTFWQIVQTCPGDGEKRIMILFLKALPRLTSQISGYSKRRRIVYACKDALMNIEQRNINPRSAVEGVYGLVHC